MSFIEKNPVPDCWHIPRENPVTDCTLIPRENRPKQVYKLLSNFTQFPFTPIESLTKAEQRADRLSKAHPFLSVKQVETFLIRMMYLYEFELGYTGDEYHKYVDLVVDQACDASTDAVKDTFNRMGIA